VEAIRYLDSLWRPIAGALSVGARSIAHDDLYAGTLAQPVGERVPRPVGEQVDGGVGFHIYQDRPVAVTTTEREVVDAEHAWCGITRRC
jgi:hypothetical protein